MDFIDHIDFKQVGKVVAVDKIYFRDSFYDNFNKLFLVGYIDTTILLSTSNNNVKIRFSMYRPREEVLKHIDKLRTYYDVQMFPGFMNFDTGEIKHTMPYDYDYVRLFPEEKIEYNDGFHGTHSVNILGVFRDKADISDKNFNEELIDKKIKEILSKVTNQSLEDIKIIE